MQEPPDHGIANSRLLHIALAAGCRMKLLLRVAVLGLLASSGLAAAQSPAGSVAVKVPSLDQFNGNPVDLPGHWFAAPGHSMAPAMVLMHGCESERTRGYVPSSPLLMLLGEADDWTPAGPCKAMAAAVRQIPFPVWESYQGAHHGFDGTAPVRLRADVPNGVNPGQGVHVGADPAAREAATNKLASFVRETWRLTP